MITYEKAIEELTSQGKFYINLGLERVREALNFLGNPQEKLKCIHVAGTNGKGSTCAIIASVLQEAGYKVGLYSSPHIFDYTERIKINGAEIPKEIFAQKADKLCKLSIHLTEFEILTCIMFEYFTENNVDFAVVEVGLGGRLDATNVIEKPICSVITHIDLDHTERLGNTIEKIAGEKAGIIKKNCPVITTFNNNGLEVFEEKSDLILVKPVQNENLSLLGNYQKENLGLALGAVKIADEKIPQDVIDKGLQKVVHPCRFQFVKEKNLIIDGSHNPDGAKTLRESLDEKFPDIPRVFVFGCLKNKDYKKMIEVLFRKEDKIFFNHFDYPNSATFEELEKACKYKALPFKEFNFSKKHLTIVCGSFYMISSLFNPNK